MIKMAEPTKLMELTEPMELTEQTLLLLVTAASLLTSLPPSLPPPSPHFLPRPSLSESEPIDPMKLRESTEQLADEPMEQKAESPTLHVGHPDSHSHSGPSDGAASVLRLAGPTGAKC